MTRCVSSGFTHRFNELPAVQAADAMLTTYPLTTRPCSPVGTGSEILMGGESIMYWLVLDLYWISVLGTV